MKTIRLAAIATALSGLVSGCCGLAPHGATSSHYKLEPGDLLFQDLDGSPLAVAIETVTQGVDGAQFSHVGMVSEVGPGGVLVIEAVSAGVVETPLDEFLARSADASGRPKVLVGRLKPPYRPYIPGAIDVARACLGRPYDSVYEMDPDAYYCSELVYDAFHEASGGTLRFEVAPMTFNDPATGEPFPAWVAYYAELGVPIPEREPGINPGGISRSSAIDIVHAYGQPSGWRRATQ